MASPVVDIHDQQQPNSSYIPLSSFELEPEIYGKHSFNLDGKLDILTVADNLAMEAKCLIDVLETMQLVDICGQYQIELRKTDPHDEFCTTFRMSLRIDPLIWFKYHRLNNNGLEELEKLYEIGSSYVAKVKNETEYYPKVENENDLKRIPLTNFLLLQWCKTDRQGKDCSLGNKTGRPCGFEHYKWCFDEYAGTTGECKSLPLNSTHSLTYIHFSKLDQLKKPVYYKCRYLCTNLNRQQVPCGFCADPNFWFYQDRISNPSSYPYFIVSARSDATPVITLNPVKHCLNEAYVQTSDAWQAVLLTLIYMKNKLRLDKLPLNRIYINFGKWMQQKQDDPMRQSCHAHINIVLPRKIIEKINELYKSEDKKINVKRLFPSLVGSMLPPKSHRLDDSSELIKAMNDHMVPLCFKQNRELQRTISTLNENIEKLTEENEIYRRAIHGSGWFQVQPDDDAQGTSADDIATAIDQKLLFEGVDLDETNE